MTRRWWVLVAIVLAAFVATGFALRHDNGKPNWKELAPYVVEDRTYIGAPLDPTSKTKHYGVEWHVISVTGITEAELLKIVKARLAKEPGWQPLNIDHSIGFQFMTNRGPRRFNVEVDPALQGYALPKNPFRSPDGPLSDEVFKSGRVLLTESKPLSHADYIWARILHLGRSPYEGNQ